MASKMITAASSVHCMQQVWDSGIACEDSTILSVHICQGCGNVGVGCVQARLCPPVQVPLSHFINLACDTITVRTKLCVCNAMSHGSASLQITSPCTCDIGMVRYSMRCSQQQPDSSLVCAHLISVTSCRPAEGAWQPQLQKA